MFRKIAALTAAMALGVGGFAASASADEVVSGGSASNPIIVKNVSDVPEGAVEDKVSTYNTSAKCDSTRSWVLPGTPEVTETRSEVVQEGTPGTPAIPPVPAVYEDVKVIDQEYVPAVPPTPPVIDLVKVIDQAYVPPTPPTPPIEEVSHMEQVLVTPGTPEVKEVSHQECTTQYHFRKYTQTREGTKKNGVIVWGAYGPWTPWEPETHTSWENSNAPLGSPAPHADGKNGNVYWERVWQARFDGKTRQVDCHKVIDVEGKPAVPPVYKDVKVIDQEYVPGTPGTPEILEVSHMVEVVITPGTPGSPAIEEVSHIEQRLVTPEVPGIPGTPPTPRITRTVTVVVSEATDPQYFAWSDEVVCETVIIKKPPHKVTPPMELAHTGSNTGPMLGSALALIVLGAIAVIFAARKPSEI